MSSMVDLANTLLRGPGRGVDVSEVSSADSAENAPTAAPGKDSTPHSGSLNARITQAWDDLAEIARDARCLYGNEGFYPATEAAANAAVELARVFDLIAQAERNAEPRG